MMFSLLVAAAAFQGTGMPNSYVGLWTDRSDRIFMVGSPSLIEYTDGDMWGMVHSVYQAPNQDFVGTWSQSKSLYGDRTDQWPLQFDFHSARNEWGKPVRKQFETYKSPFLEPMFPDNVRYTGEFRMTPKGNSFPFTRTDSKGLIAQNDMLYPLGKWADATVGGVYKDAYANLDVAESPASMNWSVKGEFKYGGSSYIVQGERLFTRGRTTLVDARTGNVVGFLAYGYNPTPSQVKRYRSGEWGPTDRILVNFVVPGVKTMQVRVLTR